VSTAEQARPRRRKERAIRALVFSAVQANTPT
jgi:hypothetical protein